MIDYRLLQALSAVLEEGGFERAAHHLFLTQSAVSQRIKQLEAQLGQPVLVRSTPPRATSVGQRLYNHMQQVQQLEAELGLSGAPDNMTIRMTVNADSLATWLPAALVLPEHDTLRFNISVDDQAVGLRQMKQGEVMACLCASAERLNGGSVVPLGKMRYRALASPEFILRHRLHLQDGEVAAENGSPVHRERLAQAPCLVFNRDDPLQHWFLAEVANTEPRRIHLCPSSEGFVQSALAGLGYGLMPELQIYQHLSTGRLRDIVPGYVLDTPLYWHHWQTESQVMVALRQSIVSEAARHLYPLVDPG
ncbi:LysR family transcriptional regulator ArgP [Allohahella marinimesophila]|uniref:LysR family transcriptional regulator ArgP n=1 Tax=Allohahella marinimesophila TaxID=1054972 RepID=A0ABP7PHH0_9GAMM